MFDIRRCTSQHIDDVVQIHLDAFTNFFLTRLGRSFLRQLYLAFLRDDAASCFIALDSKKTVVGFIAGTNTPDLFFRNLLLFNWHKFLCASLTLMIHHPITVGRKLLGAIFYRGDFHDLPFKELSLISSFAVDPKVQGKGCGQELLAVFENWTQAHGGKGVYLLTDASDNTKTNQFYLKNGFLLNDIVKKSDGREMNRFVKKFL
ncbi:GNAT family N-acetyltransferase [Halodesulfovibrio aestuarii]|uniref:Acetyltransferase (GNAT) family protein n=1 Tax=Halodesulfovibrio aestuarii TaxID=126333 RepID=A0A8G2F9C9_9BACT|nr:GNAT family N-acetyltransferase [Halodesulfovibrio aestuarii]SHJ29034.1 Acetyltransferase (GNAT) family protein [Halodesulfovibrio aestuarii]